MLAAGKLAQGGDAANLRWIIGRVEDVPLDPPYALIHQQYKNACVPSSRNTRWCASGSGLGPTARLRAR